MTTPTTPTTLDEFNRLETAAAGALIFKCCASDRWAERMTASRPYHSMAELTAAADAHWRQMTRRDVLQAFRGHPEIGRPDSPEGAHDTTRALAEDEQSGMARASAGMRAALAKYNRAYAKKFGFIFIVCASGKSAEQMLGLIRTRLGNTRETEIANAAEEQRKITRIRIHALLGQP